MRKRLLLGLILLFFTLIWLYQIRLQLLTTAVNAVLEKSDIRVLHLAGLDIGWNRVEIGEVELSVGENNAPQSLQQVHLEYSLIDIQPQRLTISTAVLSVPATSETATDAQAEVRLLLTELAGQLLAVPLQSVAVGVLEVSGITLPLVSQPLQLQASWDGPVFSLQVQDREKQLRLRLQRAGPDQLVLTSHLESNDQPIIQLSATVSGHGEQQLLQGEGRLVVEALAPLLAPLVDFPELANAVSGEVVFHCEYAETLHCNSTLAMQSQAPELTIYGERDTVVTGLKLQLSSQLTLDDNKLTLILAAGELLRAEAIVRGDIRVSLPALIADSTGTVSFQLDTGQLRLQMDRLQLLLPRAEMPEMNLATRFSLSDLELFKDAEKPLRGRVHLGTDGINLQRTRTWLPALALQADVTLDQALVSISGKVRSDEQKPLFAISAEYQLETARGTGRLLADTISFDADSNRLSQHFTHWPFAWDVYQGHMMLDVGVVWGSGEEGIEIQGKISQRLQGLAGVYGDIGFIGLDGAFEAEFSSPDQLVTTRDATLSLETLEVGVPIKDIQVRFQVDAAQQQLTLQSVEARVFGGRVWTKDALYRAGNARNRIDIGVDGLQLGQLLALAGYDAVQGTGRISGLLPVDVTATGVIMERGLLAAKEPGGVFRYSTEVTANTNPAMVQVIEALSNYHYSIFQVEADYLENGDLELQMLLRGSNPDYEQGRPIHLNLNVTDNIPMLLKSLQSGRVIADNISKRLGGPP